MLLLDVDRSCFRRVLTARRRTSIDASAEASTIPNLIPVYERVGLWEGGKVVEKKGRGENHESHGTRQTLDRDGAFPRLGRLGILHTN